MRHELTRILLAMVLAGTGIEAAGEKKSAAQKTLEILDAWCVQNQDDFTTVDRMARAFGAKELDASLSQSDPVIHQRGGRSYSLKYEGIMFFVAYANDGGCSVATQGVDNRQLERLLLKNYRLALLGTDTAGIQIQKIFQFSKSSPYSDGMISLVYAKPETEITAISVGFVPSKVWRKNRGR